MPTPKEVQQPIFKQEEVKSSYEELFSVLRLIAPGTHIRAGINGILNAGKGAIIVVSNSYVQPLLDGGFRLNSKFSSQKLIELSKMDGAIILSKDMKRIVSANVLLSPSNSIKTNETGTRHKAAERTAKQANTLVIAISERRKEITLYYKNIRYPIEDSSEILLKSNEYMQIIERQRELFDTAIEKLTALEFRNQPSLPQAVQAIQRGKIMEKLAEEVEKSIIELGKDGTLLKPRLKELISGVERETNLVVKDYTQTDMKRSLAMLSDLSYDELFDKEEIITSLSPESPINNVPIKGWRLLSKTSLHDSEIASIIQNAGTLGKAIYSGISFHTSIVGREKAEIFKDEIDSMKFQLR